MVQHDELHLKARVCAIKCWFKASCKMSAAQQAFEEQWNEVHKDHRISDTYKFIKLSVSKLETEYDLHDGGGQGRHLLLSHEDAIKCVDILAQGYPQRNVVIDQGGTQEYDEIKQYTSLSEALHMSAALRALTTDKNMSPEYVQGRLHDVAPYLVYGQLPMKLPLPPDVIEARQQYCIEMLRRIAADPDFLKCVFWVDECRIWFNRDLAGRLRVWYDRRKLAGQPPEDNPLFDLHGSKRIDFLLILNARLGCVYVEFLTGTTDIDTMGRLNPGMREHIARRAEFEIHSTKLTEKLRTGCYRVSHL
jgi:hypothetical protein